MASNTVERIRLMRLGAVGLWTGDTEAGVSVGIRHARDVLDVHVDGEQVMCVDCPQLTLSTEDMMTLTGGVLDWSKIKAAKGGDDGR